MVLIVFFQSFSSYRKWTIFIRISENTLVFGISFLNAFFIWLNQKDETCIPRIFVLSVNKVIFEEKNNWESFWCDKKIHKILFLSSDAELKWNFKTWNFLYLSLACDLRRGGGYMEGLFKLCLVSIKAPPSPLLNNAPSPYRNNISRKYTQNPLSGN